MEKFTDSKAYPHGAVQGVGCNVAHCKYNDAACKSCTADHISVQNKSAIKKGETFCDTFAPKSEA